MLAISQQATLETRQAKHEPRSPGRAAPHLAHRSRRSHRQPARTQQAHRRHHRPQPPGGSRAAITDEWVARAGRTGHRHRRRNPLHLAGQPRARRDPTAAALHRSPRRRRRSSTASWQPPWPSTASPSPPTPTPRWASRRRCAAATAPASTPRHDTTVYTSARGDGRRAAHPGRRRPRVAAASPTTPASAWHCSNSTPSTVFELNDGQQQLVRDDGHLRRAAAAGAGTGRHRQNHRHGGAGRRVAQQRRHVIGLAPTAVSGRSARRRPRRHHRHHRQTRSARRTPAGMRPPPPPTIPPAHGSTPSAPTLCSSSTKPAWPPPPTSTPSSATRWPTEPACAWSATTNNWPRSPPAGCCATSPHATTPCPLNTVVRFTHPESARPKARPASLCATAIRPASAFYIDHHRVHVGADHVAADMAYRAWAADLVAGPPRHPAGTHQRPGRRTQRTRPPGPAAPPVRPQRLGHRHPRRRSDRLDRRLDHHPQATPAGCASATAHG